MDWVISAEGIVEWPDNWGQEVTSGKGLAVLLEVESQVRRNPCLDAHSFGNFAHCLSILYPKVIEYRIMTASVLMRRLWLMEAKHQKSWQKPNITIVISPIVLNEADYVVVDIILFSLFISVIPCIQPWAPMSYFFWIAVSLDFSFIFRKKFAFYETSQLICTTIY